MPLSKPRQSEKWHCVHFYWHEHEMRCSVDISPLQPHQIPPTRTPWGIEAPWLVQSGAVQQSGPKNVGWQRCNFCRFIHSSTTARRRRYDCAQETNNHSVIFLLFITFYRKTLLISDWNWEYFLLDHWNPCMLHNWTICLDHTDVFGKFHSTFIRSKDVFHNTHAYDPGGTHLTSYLLQLIMSWTNRKSLFQSSHLLFHQMACHCLMSRVMEQQRMERFLLKGNRYK